MEAQETRYESIEPLLPEIERCLKCGICRSVCPVLAETLDESAGARGRIALVEALREGTLRMSDLFADRLSKCLNCKSCMEVCPSGIRVDEIVLAARAEIFKRGRFPLIKKLIFRNLLKRGRLLPPVSKTLAFIEGRILKGLPPKSPYRILLPLVKIDKDRILPVFAERTVMDDLAEVIAPEGAPRMRVAFFLGCSMNLIYTEVGKAAVRTLLGEGIEVVIPRDQGCCGMPVYSSGDRETGLALANKNVSAFVRHKVDAIVTACASCGVALKNDYGKILNLGAGALGAPVYDFAEFLETLPGRKPPARRVGAKTRVTFHYPCHLAHGQGIREAPRNLLRSLPEVEFVEMEEADRCCGGGGTFSLTHYDLAKAIGKRKAACIEASRAEVVVTSCPSCMMQLADMIKQNEAPQKVVHLAELIAEHYPPLPPSAYRSVSTYNRDSRSRGRNRQSLQERVASRRREKSPRS
jgi:glycolate oxidase iron-sulfur subunit